ncbi:MAG: PEP-CTERM sorting domain-containing protein [Bryobacteraceae bacterium]|nr:PEP-CTERM sorting domain-containing protein [Bryobacteraceae bacterium]
MRIRHFGALVLALASASYARAEIVYNNTTTDTFDTYLFSVYGANMLGDAISLDGLARSVSSASVQFYNNSINSNGSFSATLRFYNTGSPVGAQLGPAYTLNNLAIGAMSILTATFSNLNTTVPNNLVFAVSVSNVSPGLDLGLTAFNPPTVGTSDNSALILQIGSTFSTGAPLSGSGNLYFRLDAVPEPGTLALSVVALAYVAARLRRNRQEPAA